MDKKLIHNTFLFLSPNIEKQPTPPEKRLPPKKLKSKLKRRHVNKIEKTINNRSLTFFIVIDGPTSSQKMKREEAKTNLSDQFDCWIYRFSFHILKL